jgi:hypothetical protein
MSTKGGAGGNRKSSKKDQPKRRRYIASGRMVTNAVKNLERHLKLYSPGGEDAMATATLARLRGTK